MGETRRRVLVRESLVKTLLETIRSNPGYVVDELGQRLIKELDEMPHGVEERSAFFPLLKDLMQSGLFKA